MRSNKVAFLVILITLLIAACSAAPGSIAQAPVDQPVEQVVQPPVQDNSSWLFETGADPINVTLVADADRTVQMVIPVEGGTLSTTAADGTLYTLEIPSDALLNATTISLTPVTSITGMPFGSQQTYSVQLGPDGLYLYNFAILTITPAVEIPVNEQIVFGYHQDGTDLILAAPVVDSSQIQIQVLHFSGSGVTRGLLADIEPVRQRLGGDAERRLQNAVNAELIRLRQQGAGGDEVSTLLIDYFDQFEEQVVRPRVAAAGESCAAGRLALQTVFSLERQRQLLGISEGGNPLDKYPGLMDAATRVCVLEESAMCVEDHIIHRMLPVWLGFERHYALLGITDSAVLLEARELTVNCLTFRLMFESTGTLDLGEGGYESNVTSEITLRFDPDDFTITGEAPLVNSAFEFYWPCAVTSIPGGGGPFKVFNLEILVAPFDPLAQLGNVDDFNLYYMPGNTSESANAEICGSQGSMPIPPFPAWTQTFLVTHIDEMTTGSSSTDSGFLNFDWQIFGDEYFAMDEWSKESGEVSEAGSFHLYHSPGG